MEEEVEMKPEDKKECKRLLKLSDKLMWGSLWSTGLTCALALVQPALSGPVVTTGVLSLGIVGVGAVAGTALGSVLTHRRAVAKFGKAAVKTVQREMGVDEYKRDLNKHIAEAKKYYGIDAEKNSDKLQDKEKFISGFSKKLREAREDAVSQAEKKGRPLSASEVMKLRKAEEMKRFEANKKLMERRKNER